MLNYIIPIIALCVVIYPVYQLTRFNIAFYANDKDTIIKTLKKKPFIIKSSLMSNIGYLERWAKRNEDDLIKLYFEEGYKKSFYHVSTLGMTLAEKNNLEMLIYLSSVLDRDVFVKILCHKTVWKKYAIEYAIINNNNKMVEFILENVPPNFKKKIAKKINLEDSNLSKDIKKILIIHLENYLNSM